MDKLARIEIRQQAAEMARLDGYTYAQIAASIPGLTADNLSRLINRGGVHSKYLGAIDEELKKMGYWERAEQLVRAETDRKVRSKYGNPPELPDAQERASHSDSLVPSRTNEVFAIIHKKLLDWAVTATKQRDLAILDQICQLKTRLDQHEEDRRVLHCDFFALQGKMLSGKIPPLHPVHPTPQAPEQQAAEIPPPYPVQPTPQAHEQQAGGIPPWQRLNSRLKCPPKRDEAS